jgi:hypothetical protein
VLSAAVIRSVERTRWDVIEVGIEEATGATASRGPADRDSSPLVTVAIPTYNRVAGLKAAVDSVLAQDYPRLEIVIADNASTDGTDLYAASLAAQEPRVRLLPSAVNQGATWNFVRAHAAATGTYFMWLGDDDWIDPGYVTACVAELERDPNVALVAGEAEYHRGATFAYTGATVQTNDADGPARVRSYYRQVRDNGTGYGVFRNAVLAEIPELANEMGADWFLLAGVAYHGKIRTVPGPRIHRALGGATASLRNVAVQLGLPRFSAEFPQLHIAWLAFVDTAWRSKAFDTLSRPRRFVLGAQCASIVIARFVIPSIPKYVRQKVRGRPADLKSVAAPDEVSAMPQEGTP